MPRELGSADALLAEILSRRRRLRRTVVVGISGVDCAGKSTLAEWLRRRLEQCSVPAVLVPGDEFTRPREVRRANPDQARGYYGESFDYSSLFRELVGPARAGARVDVRLRVEEHRRERRVVVEPGSVVLVEGVFLLADGGTPLFDLALWIELALPDALARAKRRPFDLERYGGPDGVEREYERRFLAGQRLHLELDRPHERADVVLPAGCVPATAD